jgi:hypothetical protein
MDMQRQCLEQGIACFASLDAAIKAIYKLMAYYENKEARS